MRYLSVCSGIEAATQAWAPRGWEAVAFSEIEPFPCAVLAHHYPTVPNLGDMTKFEEWPDEPIDLLCGGTPCQAFSVAGLRKGLADPRGNLMLTYGAIAGRYRPRWLVWENVPGVLSSNGGRDFGTFLGMLAELGYGFAYRVLDAQYVRTPRFPRAVPQRRRRVWLVGHLGDWRRAAAVLFDRESLSGHPAPRREAGEGFAQVSIRRPDVCSGPQPDLISMAHGQAGAEIAIGHSPTLTCNHEAPIVANTLRGEGFDASEDGTGRQNLIQVAFDCKGTEVQFTMDDVNPTLRSMGHNNSHQNAGGHAAVAFAENSRAEIRLCGGDGQVSSQLLTGGGKPGQGYPAVAFDLRGREGGAMPEGPHDTANIRASSGGSSRSYVAQPYAVRRLTPRECERLQGFPDDFTRIPWRKKAAADCPDGPRYKALGNSWAVNCADWIGERIDIVDKIEVTA